MINIKIQDGCSQRCSYCIVNKLRGTPFSIPYETIYEDIAFFTKQLNTREVCICGINSLEYKTTEVKDFCALINRILFDFPDLFIHIDNINPFNKKLLLELLKITKDNIHRINDKFCISLQSVSDEVLKRMHRPYTKSDLEEIFDFIKQNNLSVFVELICGFPGETDEDFNETCEFIEKYQIDFIVHNFSPRPGTEAATLPDRVPEKTILERMEKYKELKSKVSKC